MKRSDWIGLSVSVVLHGALALLFAAWSAASPPPQQLGYVEVEFGEFQAGQPVEATEAVEEEAAPEDETDAPEPETEPEEETTEPENQPVDLPEEAPADEETVPPEEEEAEPPETEPQPELEQAADEQEPSETPGDTTGDPGAGATEEASAPYDIEGLDRDPQFAPLPAYPEKVNARIEVRITVDPEGRVVRRVPLRRDNPRLVAAVMDALNDWRFNALPPGAPQENQTGTVIFTFRLE